jgi:hypothetical protein
MGTLRYSISSLGWFAAMLGIGLAGCIFLFLHPELTMHLHGRAAILSGQFGHRFMLPLLTLVCALGAWRAAMLMVDPRAIECTPTHLIATTFAGRKRIAWSDLTDISIATPRYGGTKYPQLVLRRATGGLFGPSSVKLLLTRVDLPKSRYDDYVVELMAMKQRETGRAFDAKLSAPAALPEPGAFDADAALARYMAKKAAGLIEAPDTPSRLGGFGRRAL